ncbi:lpg1661 family Dot/Icm T4SS effector [Spirosoma harenae]
MVAAQTKPDSKNLLLKRVLSIDVFRALTMLTMIFVNDLWTLTDIPLWLEHAKSDQDSLGFADTVFPCFLFIVGMSVPFSVRQRINSGDSYGQISWHIIVRSIALIIMGVFTVNLPDLNGKATGFNSSEFQLLMVLSFFLIWNQYPKREGMLKAVFTGLQVLGVGLMLFLAIRFRGGPSEQLTRMAPQWWGILGLIGWTYLTCALLYLFLHKQPILLIASWVFFTLLNIAGHSGWLHQLWPDGPRTWIPDNGAFVSFAFAGILATFFLTRAQQTAKRQPVPLVFIGAGILFLIAGFLARNFFIISKIQATPTWIFLCCGIACIVYAGLYWLVDLNEKGSWFDLIKPAGTSTLTCYLIPYAYYSLADLSGISLPESLKTGGVGLVKSLLFAFLIISITAVLGKLKIKLKL